MCSNQLGLKRGGAALSVALLAAFALAGCGDDTGEPSQPTAGAASGGSSAGSPSGSSGSSNAGAPSAGGSSQGGSAAAGSAGQSTAGAGTANGGGGSAGSANGAAGTSHSAAGSGNEGGAGPTCPHIDGGTDPATCTSYCADAVTNCGDNSVTQGKVADTDTCLSFCRSFTEVQLCCRAAHVKYAPSDADFHCKHAVGIDQC